MQDALTADEPTGFYVRFSDEGLFKFGHRAVAEKDVVKLTGVPVRIEATSEIAVTFCPWCGASLMGIRAL
jgi:hypothetical protein